MHKILLKLKGTKGLILSFVILSAIILLFAYLKMSGIFFNFYVFALLLLLQFIIFVLMIKNIISKHL